MEFVQQSSQENENRSLQLRPPEIRPIEPYRPIRKHSQDEVFSNVGAFSNHVVPHVDFVGG